MRRVWGFVMVLVCSRLVFLRPVLAMDPLSWVEAHVLALEFFGGSPRRIVPENVPRNIFGVVCPPASCGRRRDDDVMTAANGPALSIVGT